MPVTSYNHPKNVVHLWFLYWLTILVGSVATLHLLFLYCSNWYVNHSPISDHLFFGLFLARYWIQDVLWKSPRIVGVGIEKQIWVGREIYVGVQNDKGIMIELPSSLNIADIMGDRTVEKFSQPRGDAKYEARNKQQFNRISVIYSFMSVVIGICYCFLVPVRIYMASGSDLIWDFLLFVCL